MQNELEEIRKIIANSELKVYDSDGCVDSRWTGDEIEVVMGDIEKILQVPGPLTIKPLTPSEKEKFLKDWEEHHHNGVFTVPIEITSETDAIDFMTFRDKHCTSIGNMWMTLFAGDGGKLYTIPELYAYWKKLPKEPKP